MTTSRWSCTRSRSCTRWWSSSTAPRSPRHRRRTCVCRSRSGLDWPNRIGGVGRPLDWTSASSWTFEPLDDGAFPAVALAKAVGRAGATFPAVYNAANEQAVDAFHEGRLPFLGIVDTISRVVDAHEPPDTLTVESLAEAEAWARRTADQLIAKG